MEKDRVVTFDVGSPPYLWATEYPWLGLDRSLIAGSRVLTIAGSGELPVYFQASGAVLVEAVDISRRACHLNELKRAALQCLPWDLYARFFLSGIKIAYAWLAKLGLGQTLRATERLELFERLGPLLSEPAKAYWGSLMETTRGIGNPFAPLLRPTDFLCPNAIPLLTNASAYEVWRAALKPCRLRCCAMNELLESSKERFDFIYCSNMLEYLRSDRLLDSGLEAYRGDLHRWLERVGRRLDSGGALACYVFAAPESDSLAAFVADFGNPKQHGYRLEMIPIECRSQLFAGTRLRHTVLTFRKA